MKRYLINIWLSISASLVGAQEKPNFLFILTDDQTYQTIHALNNEEVDTPAIDKLVAEGVSFTHTYNQGSWHAAVCVASRAMIITGQNVFRAPRNENYLDSWAHLKGNEIMTEVPLWMEVFRNNGYQTFLTGKWHNSDYAVLKSFDKAEAIADGMYETRDENGNRLGYERGSADTEWTPWDTKYNGHWTPKVNDIVYDENGKKKIGPSYTINQHTTELFSAQAIQFLRNDAKSDSKPFFMFVSFNAPHDPRQSPKEFVDMYPPSEIKIPENYVPEHLFNQGDNKVRDEQLAPFPRTKEAVQLHRSEYYAIISHADHEISRILKALENSGKMDNTYVILTSDHGLAVGHHGLMGKQNQYEHSIRVPLIIKGPGLESGKKVHEMVYVQSLYATTCDLAGIEIPETVDFRSLQNLLKSDHVKGEDYIFGAYRHLQRMIRSKKYKLIVYPQITRIQLFDMEKDPHEITDLSDKKEYEKVKDQLLIQLVKMQKENGDFMVLEAENYLN